MSSISKRTLGFSVAAAMSVWLAAAAPAWADLIPVFASGHCDLCADYNAMEEVLELHYHFHTGSPGYDEDGNPLEGEYDPSALYTRVSDDTKTTVPSNPAYGFLGAPAGSDVWVLSQNNVPGQPFLGFGTEELDPDDWATGITYTLVSASGPGEFSMWMTDPWGTPIAYWATSNGIGPSDIYTQPALAHSHANWGFTAEGVYGVQMQISGTRDGGATVHSDVKTFTFLVGPVPEPGTLALLCSGAAGVLLSLSQRRRHTATRA